MTWKDEALCHGMWEIFDGVDDEYPRLAEAKAICARCPVFEQCKAAGKNEVAGIWAGEAK